MNAFAKKLSKGPGTLLLKYHGVTKHPANQQAPGKEACLPIQHMYGAILITIQKGRGDVKLSVQGANISAPYMEFTTQRSFEV